VPPRKSAATPDPSPPTRKRRWKRRLLITGLILLVLGALANGPGARWLIHRSIRSELTKLGMEGDLRVEGRLSSGFTFLDGNFASPDTGGMIHEWFAQNAKTREGNYRHFTFETAAVHPKLNQ
jgi:hypothetical protein